MEIIDGKAKQGNRSADDDNNEESKNTRTSELQGKVLVEFAKKKVAGLNQMRTQDYKLKHMTRHPNLNSQSFNHHYRTHSVPGCSVPHCRKDCLNELLIVPLLTKVRVWDVAAVIK
jgi:hypothetical protein